jgi:isopenicillin N synthase-like dioxygenase
MKKFYIAIEIKVDEDVSHDDTSQNEFIDALVHEVRASGFFAITKHNKTTWRQTKNFITGNWEYIDEPK